MKNVKIKVFLKGHIPAMDISDSAVVDTDKRNEFKIGDIVQFDDPYIADQKLRGKISNLDSFTDEETLYVVINVINY